MLRNIYRNSSTNTIMSSVPLSFRSKTSDVTTVRSVGESEVLRVGQRVVHSDTEMTREDIL